jgi:hypothetical protein
MAAWTAIALPRDKDGVQPSCGAVRWQDGQFNPPINRERDHLSAQPGGRRLKASVTSARAASHDSVASAASRAAFRSAMPAPSFSLMSG